MTRRRLVWTLIVGTALLASPARAAVPCDGNLHRLPSHPLPVPLVDVSMIDATRGWAVGVRFGNVHNEAVAMRWNGIEWHRVPMMNRTTFRPQGVFAADRRHVWAVCYRNRADGADAGSEIQFWDGEAWGVIDAPLPHGSTTRILAVGGSSATDVWLAGDYFSATRQEYRIVALHWDGAAWTRTFVPKPRTGGATSPIEVNDIAALSSSDAWMIGSAVVLDHKGFSIHWDGSRWTRVRVPDAAAPEGTPLYGIDAVAPHDAWAVGTYAGAFRILHWDGASWDEVVRQDPNPYNDYLFGVVAVGSDEVWAVGSAHTSVSPWDWDPLALRFDGVAWGMVDPDDPDPDDPGVELLGIDAAATGEVFAVGSGPGGTYSVSGCMP